ncbi:MAG: glycine-rich domain-containing protein [Acidimicrobiales bacterium]
MLVGAVDVRHGKDLIDGELFTRLAGRVAQEHQIPIELAGRIMDQTLAFVVTSAAHPGAFLRPSRQVDTGWHTFLLDTRAYQLFCGAVTGVFIHHTPEDDPHPQSGALELTVQAMVAAGFEVDRELWDTAANCGEVGCGAGRPPPA